ncbi:MAG: hypothetical protein JST54_03055 [Deltaproteobacteria bacterium]|nr:hypothetical protein [Deltaproteobacteria bacterium]
MKTLIGISVLALLCAACSGSKSSTSTSTSGSSGATTAGTTGSSGTIDPGCGTVSEQGSCQDSDAGSIAVYCYSNDLDDGGTGIVNLDCSTLVADDPNFACGEVSTDYGVDCMAATGTDCGFVDQQGNPLFSFCQGTGAGCVLGASGAKCETGLTPCSNFPDGGRAPAVCSGNLLVAACQVNQPVDYDCSAFGGSCSNAQCVNLTAGAPCDLPDAGEIVFVCGSGLHCDLLPDGGGQACGS